MIASCINRISDEHLDITLHELFDESYADLQKFIYLIGGYANQPLDQYLKSYPLVLKMP